MCIVPRADVRFGPFSSLVVVKTHVSISIEVLTFNARELVICVCTISMYCIVAMVCH